MVVPPIVAAIGTWVANHIWQILAIVFGALGIYFVWQWGSSITTGVQQAAPGIGQAVASMGMLFSLLPPVIMMMMMMWIMSTFTQLFR